jgi:hypothetical protein
VASNSGVQPGSGAGVEDRAVGTAPNPGRRRPRRRRMRGEGDLTQGEPGDAMGVSRQTINAIETDRLHALAARGARAGPLLRHLRGGDAR